MEYKHLPNPETETQMRNPSPELTTWLPFHVYYKRKTNIFMSHAVPHF